jgi:hypothetical protein
MSYLLPLESSFPVKDIGKFLYDGDLLVAVLRTLSQPIVAAFHGGGGNRGHVRQLGPSLDCGLYASQSENCDAPINRSIFSPI